MIIDYSKEQQGYEAGKDKIMARKQQQEMLTQLQEQTKAQQRAGQLGEQTQAQQIEHQQLMLQQEIKSLKNAKTKEGLFRAFDDGTLVALNNFIKNDSNIKSIFPGIQSMEKIDQSNQAQLNQSRGMDKPVVMNVVQNGQLVKRVVDLEDYKMRSGYSAYAKTREAEQSSLDRQAEYSTKLNEAIASGDINKIRQVHAMYQGATTKPKTASEQLNELKLGAEMKSAEIKSYVEDNPRAFRNTLSTGNLDTKIAGHSLYGMAVQVQGDNKISSTRRDYLDGMVSTIENTNKLREKLATSDFDWDALSKGMDEVSRITGTEWRNLSTKEKQDMLNRFSFDSELKTVMAGYIKAMSGAAVSDQERAFYEKAILGGNWSTKETAVASMDGFMVGLLGGTKSAVTSLMANTPATYLNYKDRIKSIKIFNSEVKKPTTPTSSGTQEKPKYTPEQIEAAKAELARRRSQGAN